MIHIHNNYYVSSFFWNTISKVLNALFGFVTVPLLLGLYGKANYGILALATSCNGYMQLLDLGMNIGAVKFFSQWRAEGKHELVQRVAGTNITFYFIIALINIFGLLALALFGEPLFNVNHAQFILLRQCLLIIAVFCLFSWEATPFNQLLIADKQMVFTMQLQTILSILKFILIGVTLYLRLSLVIYFFFLTLILALLIVPYAWKNKIDGIIKNFRPQFYWNDFKIVLTFSLSIFALSLFQVTSTQSRPIILSIFAQDGLGAVADFRIMEVMPNLILMIAGTFSGIFLPKTSEMVVKKNQLLIEKFAYKWTILTTIITCLLSFPFLIGADSILSAYVGIEYKYLSSWLIIWIFIIILQAHTTPCNALILAYGKTKLLVVISASACVISMLINALLARTQSVGSAVIGYAVYVLIMSLCNYLFFYKQLLKISNNKILKSFIIPIFWAVIAAFITCFIKINRLDLYFIKADRIAYLIVFAINAIAWCLLYLILLFFFKVITLKNKTIQTLYD